MISSKIRWFKIILCCHCIISIGNHGITGCFLLISDAKDLYHVISCWHHVITTCHHVITKCLSHHITFPSCDFNFKSLNHDILLYYCMLSSYNVDLFCHNIEMLLVISCFLCAVMTSNNNNTWSFPCYFVWSSHIFLLMSQ